MVKTPYPPESPSLLLGVRYHWQLEAPNVSTQQAYFEILNSGAPPR